MSMEIRPGYVNPLTMVKGSKLNPKAGQAMKQDGTSGNIRDLQARQQQLQNTMLLMKAAGSDSSGMSPKTEKRMEEELKKVSRELQKAKKEEAFQTAGKRERDIYEKSGGILPKQELLEEKEVL